MYPGAMHEVELHKFACFGEVAPATRFHHGMLRGKVMPNEVASAFVATFDIVFIFAFPDRQAPFDQRWPWPGNGIGPMLELVRNNFIVTGKARAYGT